MSNNRPSAGCERGRCGICPRCIFYHPDKKMSKKIRAHMVQQYWLGKLYDARDDLQDAVRIAEKALKDYKKASKS